MNFYVYLNLHSIQNMPLNSEIAVYNFTIIQFFVIKIKLMRSYLDLLELCKSHQFTLPYARPISMVFPFEIFLTRTTVAPTSFHHHLPYRITLQWFKYNSDNYAAIKFPTTTISLSTVAAQTPSVPTKPFESIARNNFTKCLHNKSLLTIDQPI